MHSKLLRMHSLRAARRWPWSHLLRAASLVCWTVLAGFAFTPQLAASEQAGVLRVLKLRYQEVNHPHRDTAGEFRLLSDFARERGMVVEWSDAVLPSDLAARLARGEGDIVIADLTPELSADQQPLSSVSMGSYHYAVYGRVDIEARDPTQLQGLRVAIALSSPMWSYLNALTAQVRGLRVVVMPDDTTREKLLAGVESGLYDAAVVTARPQENPVAALPRVRSLFTLSASTSAVWRFSSHDPGLRDQVNAFLQRSHATRVRPQAAFGDLKQIRQRHVLRVITRIDPHNFFLKGGKRAGFEYELVSFFSRDSRLNVEFLVAESERQALQWLREGRGDVVTARINSSSVEADSALQQSRRYFHSATVIANQLGGPALDTAGLVGKRVAVGRGSMQHRILGELVASGVGVEPVIYASRAGPEMIAAALELGHVDAALLDAYDLSELSGRHPGIRAGSSVATDFNYAWTMRKLDVELQSAVDDFLSSQFRMATYNVLAQRYFKHGHATRVSDVQKISPFDELVRQHAAEFDFDWRLITALMYQESKFDPSAESSAGARGLMQLLPATARSLGVLDAFDPETAIRGGVAYLDQLRGRFNQDISPRERTWFALAAYNNGYQRIARAQRRAAEQGYDPNRWFGHVEQVMRNMARGQRRCGCGQAVVYVRRIRSLYNTYSRSYETLTTTAGQSADAPAT